MCFFLGEGKRLVCEVKVIKCPGRKEMSLSDCWLDVHVCEQFVGADGSTLLWLIGTDGTER